MNADTILEMYPASLDGSQMPKLRFANSLTLEHRKERLNHLLVLRRFHKILGREACNTLCSLVGDLVVSELVTLRSGVCNKLEERHHDLGLLQISDQISIQSADLLNKVRTADHSVQVDVLGAKKRINRPIQSAIEGIQTRPHFHHQHNPKYPYQILQEVRINSNESTIPTIHTNGIKKLKDAA